MGTFVHGCWEYKTARLLWRAVLKKVTQNPAISSLGIHPEGPKARMQTVTSSHVHGSLTSSSQKVETTHVSVTDEQINRMLYLHRQAYSALKKKLITATTQMKDNIMLNRHKRTRVAQVHLGNYNS